MTGTNPADRRARFLEFRRIAPGRLGHQHYERTSANADRRVTNACDQYTWLVRDMTLVAQAGVYEIDMLRQASVG